MIDDLAKIGFNFNIVNSLGYNALHTALDRGDLNVKIIKTLLKKGVNVNDQNFNCLDSPFHIACKMNYGAPLVKLLIDNGADINLENGKHKTSLDLIIEALRNEEVYKEGDFQSMKLIVGNEKFIAQSRYIKQLQELGKLPEIANSKKFSKLVDEVIKIVDEKLNYKTRLSGTLVTEDVEARPLKQPRIYEQRNE